ncbi:hypothetical protein [Sphingomonas sp. Leaf208]|uniref:hypothetical protein n=1 Tax=Sphingomonas sp. Leaf208 TaxID=1735679 RepID=UPI000AF2772D|nr:hypothetical protein [Sphingomonas sp. Leaf208]
MLPAIAGSLRVAGSLYFDEASVQHCLQMKRKARNIDLSVERARVTNACAMASKRSH